MKKLLTTLTVCLLAAHAAVAQNTLAGNLTVQQTVKLTGTITPAAITSNVNDYAPTGFAQAYTLRLSADAARNITGLAGGATGRTILVANVGDFPLTFINESATSTAANRFSLGLADYELVKGNTIGLWYDGTSSRWRPTNSLAVGGGGGTGTVTSVSVATANGVSGTVASPTTNPVITISLGAISPSSVAAAGTVSGSNLSGTNTGDQTDATLPFSDVTTNDVSTSKHGFAPKLPNDAAKYLDGTGAWTTPAGGGGGSGTVTNVSVVSANGVSGSVATSTTTPAITINLGAITPTSVAASGTVTGSNLSGTNTGDETGTTIRTKLGITTLSGSNTGDQTSVTGNAGTATALQTARTINGVSFDGTANITVPAAAGTLTGTTLASGVAGSSLTSAAGGTFGTAAFTNSTAYDPAGAASAITLAGLGGVPTSRTVNGHALSGNVTVTPSDLSLVIGTNTQAWSAKLDSIAALSAGSGWLHNDGAGALAWSTPSKSDVGLGSVENSALSTWTGSANLATVGTITAGTWHGSAIADTYISSAPTWNAKVSFPGFGTTAGTAAEGNDARLSDARTPTAHNQAWSTITSTPTTRSGYGITDAQPLDSDLTSIAALTTDAFGRDLLTKTTAANVRTYIGAGTSSFDGAYSSLTGIPSTFTPAAHSQAWSTITSTPTTLSGYGITDAQSIDADLTAIAGLSTTGIVARTGAGTATTRTITGTANQITVTNGDGVSGNPTLSLPQSIATGSTPTFAGLIASGNVGIGTNNPVKKLDVAGGVHVGIGTENVSNTSNGLSVQDISGADVAIAVGTTTLRSTGLIWRDGDPGAAFLYTFGDAAPITITGRDLHLNAGGAERLTVANNGIIRFPYYSAGTLVTDSSGNVTASSDARLKNVTGDFTRGLADVLKLQPKVYQWNKKSGMNTDDVNVGFIAQDVQGAIPEAVGSMKTSDVEEDDGTGKKVKKSKREASEYLTLSDRPIIATLVNAVKELKAENDDLRARVSALENRKATK